MHLVDRYRRFGGLASSIFRVEHWGPCIRKHKATHRRRGNLKCCSSQTSRSVTLLTPLQATEKLQQNAFGLSEGLYRRGRYQTYRECRKYMHIFQLADQSGCFARRPLTIYWVDAGVLYLYSFIYTCTCSASYILVLVLLNMYLYLYCFIYTCILRATETFTVGCSSHFPKH
jgi:hypothetical protein